MAAATRTRAPCAIPTLQCWCPLPSGGYGNGFKEMCSGDITSCIKVASWHVGDKANLTCDPER